MQRIEIQESEVDETIIDLMTIGSGWEKPICFTSKITLPGFPGDSLPTGLKEFVESVADSRQVPIDMPAFLALSTIATAAQRKYRVYIGNSHNEPLNLWTVTGMIPGSRKSDSYNDMTKPLQIEQTKLIKSIEQDIKEAKKQHKIQEKRMEGLLTAISKEKNDSKREILENQYSKLSENCINVPAYPAIFVSGDTTPEALASLLEEQGGKISVFDSEGGIFSIMNGRYDSKGEANLDVFLKAHSGDNLSIHRKSKSPIEVSKPALTIALTIQPSVIKNLAEKKDFKNRGLLGRFLYAIPKSLVGTRLYQDKSNDKQSEKIYHEIIRDIYSQPLAKTENEYDDNPHHKLFIKDKALEIWKEFSNDIELRQAQGGDLEHMTDWASKLASTVARIAGLFHVVDTRGDSRYCFIETLNIVRACNIANKHLIEHAKGAYGLMSMTSDVRLARNIMSWIATKGIVIFTARDFLRSNNSKADKSEDLLPAFEFLKDHEMIREVTRKTCETKNLGGRPPKHKYELNPFCKSCFKCLK